MGFIHRFLLPKEIDFVAALLAQATNASDMIRQLQQESVEGKGQALHRITDMAKQASQLRRNNMHQLLDVFITPYDKESIYRMIVALDWVALSIKHFQLETKVYGIESLQEYRAIVDTISNMADELAHAIQQLGANSPLDLNRSIDQLREQYDTVVNDCARATARLMNETKAADGCLRLQRHQTLFTQLKEIARRIHISGDSLEDMALKIA